MEKVISNKIADEIQEEHEFIEAKKLEKKEVRGFIKKLKDTLLKKFKFINDVSIDSRTPNKESLVDVSIALIFYSVPVSLRNLKSVAKFLKVKDLEMDTFNIDYDKVVIVVNVNHVSVLRVLNVE